MQGDRAPEGDAKIAALRLGTLLHAKGWGASVGAYGGFVKVLEDSGISCICHETAMRDHGDVKSTKSPVIHFGGYADLVIDQMGQAVSGAKRELSWASRLGIWMGTSQAFCFFAGREGTLAHLAPVLAYNIKGWAKEGRPRRVVLLGWDLLDLAHIQALFNIRGPATNWFMHYELEEIDDAADFLTS